MMLTAAGVDLRAPARNSCLDPRVPATMVSLTKLSTVRWETVDGIETGMLVKFWRALGAGSELEL